MVKVLKASSLKTLLNQVRKVKRKRLKLTKPLTVNLELNSLMKKNILIAIAMPHLTPIMNWQLQLQPSLAAPSQRLKITPLRVMTTKKAKLTCLRAKSKNPKKAP